MKTLTLANIECCVAAPGSMAGVPGMRAAHRHGIGQPDSFAVNLGFRVVRVATGHASSQTSSRFCRCFLYSGRGPDVKLPAEIATSSLTSAPAIGLLCLRHRRSDRGECRHAACILLPQRCPGVAFFRRGARQVLLGRDCTVISHLANVTPTRGLVAMLVSNRCPSCAVFDAIGRP
jgi:hypothetical protein